jgi:8-oxo-dGTP pyrophosphatase MutT (NUDIX family)
MFSDFINDLKSKLQQTLPGIEAQFEMAHVKRERVEYGNDKDYRPSAVLILLYPNDQEDVCILLIERSTYNGHHSGQIALPGGKVEPTDKDLEDTALREFYEETGCEEVPFMIGKLSPIHIPVSKFVVHPFVGYLSKRPIFSPNENEVKQLLEWKLSDLLLPESVKETTIEPMPGLKMSTPYFDVQEKILWGATAMMLNELKWVVNK